MPVKGESDGDGSPSLGDEDEGVKVMAAEGRNSSNEHSLESAAQLLREPGESNGGGNQ